MLSEWWRAQEVHPWPANLTLGDPVASSLSLDSLLTKEFWKASLVTFMAKERLMRKCLFGSQFQAAVHHGRELKEQWLERVSRVTEPTVRTESNEFMHAYCAQLTFFTLKPFRIPFLGNRRTDLPISIKVIRINPRDMPLDHPNLDNPSLRTSS